MVSEAQKQWKTAGLRSGISATGGNNDGTAVETTDGDRDCSGNFRGSVFQNLASLCLGLHLVGSISLPMGSIWRFPEIGGLPPNHPFIDGIFHYKPTILRISPLVESPHMLGCWHLRHGERIFDPQLAVPCESCGKGHFTTGDSGAKAEQLCKVTWLGGCGAW